MRLLQDVTNHVNHPYFYLTQAVPSLTLCNTSTSLARLLESHGNTQIRVHCVAKYRDVRLISLLLDVWTIDHIVWTGKAETSRSDV